MQVGGSGRGGDEGVRGAAGGVDRLGAGAMRRAGEAEGQDHRTLRSSPIRYALQEGREVLLFPQRRAPGSERALCSGIWISGVMVVLDLSQRSDFFFPFVLFS